MHYIIKNKHNILLFKSVTVQSKCACYYLKLFLGEDYVSTYFLYFNYRKQDTIQFIMCTSVRIHCETKIQHMSQKTYVRSLFQARIERRVSRLHFYRLHSKIPKYRHEKHKCLNSLLLFFFNSCAISTGN